MTRAVEGRERGEGYGRKNVAKGVHMDYESAAGYYKKLKIWNDV